MKKYLIIIIIALFNLCQAKGQTSFSFSCSRDTVVTSCGISCITLKAKIPNVHSSSSSYTVNPLSGTSGCYNNYVDPSTPGTSTSLTIDDRYSTVITIPFTFPFFGTNYTSLVASTNGYISFDPSLAGTFSHYGILNSGGFLAATSGTPENLPSTLYDRALIMGPYHDLDPAYTSSPNQRIKYDVVGIAPHRKWILSFYKSPLFDCQDLIENTHQIVLYEGTGIVEVFVNSIQQCAIWNQGRSMIGMQDFNRTASIMAPGRAASDPVWGTTNMNESWRFIPAAGPTLYKKVELFDLSGNLVSTGDTVSINSSTFQVSFPNVCPTATTTYVVKSTYSQMNNPAATVIGTDTVRVVRSNVISGNGAISNIACNGGTNGSVTFSPGNGTAPYQFSKDGGITFQTSPTFNNLTAGTYTIRIKDATSCFKDTTINIIQPPVIAISAPTVNSGCTAADGKISVTATGGTAPFTYSLDGTTFQSSNIFNVTSGNYTVTVKDANLCTRTLGVVVGLTNNLTLQSRTDTTVCSGQPVTLTTVSNATSFSWTPTTGLNNANIASPVATPIVATSYIVTGTSGQCVKKDTVNINMQQLVVDAGPDIYILAGEPAQLTATAIGATSYLWTPSLGLSATNIYNPIARPSATTLYTVKVQNANGCTASDNVSVIICVKVKNAFSPNGDGVNDTWVVYDSYDCLKNVTVNVFNRYGSKVFESRDYRNGWDGKYKGQPLPDGTYYAIVDFTLASGRVVSVKSDVTIIR